MSKVSQLQSELEAAAFVRDCIANFVKTSPVNRMPDGNDEVIFDEPLIQFAGGDDPLFAEYKTIIHPSHMLPREALAKSQGKDADEISGRLSVISWILPITAKAREANRLCKDSPARLWAYARWYGEKFNDALRKHVVEVLGQKGYLATAPALEPFFKTDFENTDQKGIYSNWSERHVAYAAGLGTFGLSGGFISERGIAHRCGSVVTDLKLPISLRTAENHMANCLVYSGGKCRACIVRCPGGAISEKGRDKAKCREHMHNNEPLREVYGVGVTGCGFCQTKVPCEFQNPTKTLKKTAKG